MNTEPRCPAWFHDRAAWLKEQLADGEIHTFSVYSLAKAWGVTVENVWQVSVIAEDYHGVYVNREPFLGTIVCCNEPIRKAILSPRWEKVPKVSQHHYLRYRKDAR